MYTINPRGLHGECSEDLRDEPPPDRLGPLHEPPGVVHCDSGVRVMINIGNGGGRCKPTRFAVRSYAPYGKLMCTQSTPGSSMANIPNAD